MNYKPIDKKAGPLAAVGALGLTGVLPGLAIAAAEAFPLPCLAATLAALAVTAAWALAK